MTHLSEPMRGQIVGATFEDGKDHGAGCGLEGCECPDHEGPPRNPGTYLTVRLDGDHRIGFWRVSVSREEERGV